jgi:hypothetical protein
MRNPLVRVVLLVLIAALLAIAGFVRPTVLLWEFFASHHS